MNEVVFYKKWFEDNQKWLLILANTWLGRRLLRINGDRSDVGKNKIIKIEPNAIYWRNGENIVAEFRTRAKFANRLYYGLKPIWQIFHAWDLLSNRLFPSLNLGFDTLTVYPNAHPETTTVDGEVRRELASDSGTSWSEIRSGAGTAASSTNPTTVVAGHAWHQYYRKWFFLARAIFLFDTSSLANGITVNSTALGLYGTDKNNNFPTVDISCQIYSSNPSSNTDLVPSDYGTLGTTELSTNISYTSWTVGGYNNFAGIPITIGGITKLGTRSTRDATGVEPTIPAGSGGSQLVSYIASQTSDYTGTSRDPKLVVNYSGMATISNSVSFEIENDIPLTIVNPLNAYLKYELYVNSELIKTEQIGQVTSFTIEPDGGEESAMYAEMPNATSSGMEIRLSTFSDSGYTTQIGTYTSKAGTASINQTTNKPVFTTYELLNIDKNIVVKDKYDNTLVTSSTETLLGGTDKIISGFSDVRARIVTANKMVAQNSATGIKYRLTSGVLQKEEDYSSGDTVDLDISNVILNEFSVTAIDSRNLSTVVPDTFTYMATPTPIVISNVVATRDNNVDALTKLTFGGLLWNKYFDTGTDTGSGVLNDITAHYRYKETTEAWSAQSWIEITSDVAVDSSGVITYDEYINGDLGAGGFDPEKSYNIEVRVFDSLSQQLVEITLNKGIPLIHYHSDGVAIKALYDETVGGSLQVDTINVMEAIRTGWFPIHDIWTYAGADDPSFTFTVAGDMTAVHSVGMKVKLTQTTVKYFIITKMVYSAPNTTYTVYGGTDYDLANATITDAYISNVKSPAGFPMSPFKWSVNFTDSSVRQQTNPTGGTWYNLGSLSTSIPIGIWRVSMKGSVDCGKDTGGGDRAVFSALSTSNNSVSHNKLKAHDYGYVVEWNRMAYYFEDQAVDLSSKTTFYPIFMASGGSGTWYLRSNNDQNQLIVQAECVYL